MGKDQKNGLKDFASLAGVLNGMRASEKPTKPPRANRPKQKRPPHDHGEWQRIEDIDPGLLPREIEVCLREGTHPKTGARQWQGSYTHGRDRRKVVCKPLGSRQLSTHGELMVVSLNPHDQRVPGMIFGHAEGSMAAKQLFEKDELEVTVNDLRCYRRTAYGGGVVVEWTAEAKLIDGEVEVVIEVPQGAQIPQLDETWRVKRISRSTSMSRTYRAEPLERLSEAALRPIPTEEFVFRFPDHDNNDHPLEHEGWPLAYEDWHVGDHRCHFSHLEGDTMHIEVLGFAPESTEAWIKDNLTAGKYVSVEFEADYDGEFGHGGNLVEVSSQTKKDGVDLWLTLESLSGTRKEVMVKSAGLVGGCLQGSSELSSYDRELHLCYVSAH